MHFKSNRRRLSLVLLVVAAGAALIAATRRRSVRLERSGPSGKITVWVDALREPVTDAYIKSHPNVQVTKVIFDGDGNGATTMQTKIQLWNRTGSGWPDVVFTEQANDPVWMASEAVRLRSWT